MTIIQLIMNTLIHTHAHTWGSTHSVPQPQEPVGAKKQMASVTNKQTHVLW